MKPSVAIIGVSHLNSSVLDCKHFNIWPHCHSCKQPKLFTHLIDIRFSHKWKHPNKICCYIDKIDVAMIALTWDHRWQTSQTPNINKDKIQRIVNRFPWFMWQNMKFAYKTWITIKRCLHADLIILVNQTSNCLDVKMTMSSMSTCTRNFFSQQHHQNWRVIDLERQLIEFVLFSFSKNSLSVVIRYLYCLHIKLNTNRVIDTQTINT